jgi:hypothetical protein
LKLINSGQYMVSEGFGCKTEIRATDAGRLQNSKGQKKLREVESMRSDDIQFKSVLVGIIIGAVAGIAVYIIALSLGMPAAASGGIIGGIVGAVSVVLMRRKPAHRAN